MSYFVNPTCFFREKQAQLFHKDLQKLMDKCTATSKGVQSEAPQGLKGDKDARNSRTFLLSIKLDNRNLTGASGLLAV